MWGLDLSQSMQGAGGIGGLLAKVESGATHLYQYDGNGNVGQLVNASTGSVDAQYEYDAYGNSIVASGTQAAGNPFRFSTKYLDAESGLYYYGYRYYDPETGRWTNRDPLMELGAKVIRGEKITDLSPRKLDYVYIENNSVNLVDAKGLDTLLIIIGQEWVDNSNIFITAGETATKAYRTSEYYNPEFDAVVKVDLTNAGNSAYSKVQKALSDVKQIRTILYYGHGDENTLFLTQFTDAGSNISENGGTKSGGQKFNSSPLLSLSKENITKNAFAGLYSCSARKGIAAAFSHHFGIPVEAAANAVNYDANGVPFVRWQRAPFLYGFSWVGGSPIGRNKVLRDGCWSEKDARKIGY